MTVTVKYWIATYEGDVDVTCDPYDEDDMIIAKAKRIVTRQAGGSLPFGYEKWKVIERN